MIAILISLVLDVLMILSVSTLDQVGTVAFAVFSFPLAALLVGTLLVAGGQKLLGARIVAIASLLFLPIGLVGILGARHVMNTTEPAPGDDLKTQEFFVRPMAYYTCGVLLALVAIFVREPSTFAAAALLLGIGFWRNLTPLVRTFPTSVVVEKGLLVPRRVVPRRQLTSYALRDDSITLRFIRAGKDQVLTAPITRMSVEDRQLLRAEMERLLALDPLVEEAVAPRAQSTEAPLRLSDAPKINPKVLRIMGIVAASTVVLVVGVAIWRYFTDGCRALTNKVARGELHSVDIEEQDTGRGFVRWTEGGKYRFCEDEHIETRAQDLHQRGVHLQVEVPCSELIDRVKRGEAHSAVAKKDSVGDSRADYIHAVHWTQDGDEYLCYPTYWEGYVKDLRVLGVPVTVEDQ